MKRYQFQHNMLTFSYLDSDGDKAGKALIALHAHWMEGMSFASLAKALSPEWRVIALDQRGHGHSDHAATYEREDYLGDNEALFNHLNLKEAALLGNSLGGVNAYQFAARHPKLVKALIVEDIGAEVSGDLSFTLEWKGTFQTKEALIQRIGPRLSPYLQDFFQQNGSGWKLAFDPNDMIASQNLTNGDHWIDWLSGSCPALLIRGEDSRVTTAAHLEEMASRRPNTRFVSLKGGHVVHADNPAGFEEAVKTFLHSL